MADVVMPRLSDSMEEGTILQWLKQVGDEVAVGDELVEIETDKANMAYESDLAGTLTEILVQEGETVAIGTPIARVGDRRGTRRSIRGSCRCRGPTEPPAVAKASSGAVPPQRHPRTKRPSSSAASGGGRPKASPVARRIAKERGLDLAQLRRLGARWSNRQGGRGTGGCLRGWRGLGGAENARRRSARGRQDPRAQAGQPRVPKPPRARHLRRALQAPVDRSPAAWPSRRRPRRTSTSRPRWT